ncbi:MAG: OmpH family outer membrane protein [Calditrichaeota bacterium]|nr:OmpH family outer membrane protein [Calditrichota bacterium]MCB9366371.1 OmpH family outer membrane protein [Calditrichota bacterium]MCB9391999.1 OmpH family outer membrane protein [Calditrichota bacterium]
MKKSLILLSAICFVVIPALAKEMKIGYIDSEAILSQFSDFQEAQRKLQEEEQKYMAEAQSKETVLQTMIEEIQQQSLMLSAEARAEREQKVIEKRRELEQFRVDTWGEGGKLYTRNLELSRPILERVNQVIEKISQQDGYDMVFDAAGGNIVFALPQHDITELVLAELKKE